MEPKKIQDDDPFVNKLAEAIDADQLLQPGQRVIVGVSGGADSVGLLAALWALARDEDRAYELSVAHLDHGIRVDSHKDASFVRWLANRLELPCDDQRVEAGELMRLGDEGLENAAREIRYRFFRRIVAERKADALALAHQADDQAETILFRLLRGTGIGGLGGMAASRELLPGVRIVRPMLNFWAREVREALRRWQVSWHEDASNADLAFTRNAIRHEVLPVAREAVNDQVEAAIVRLGLQARRAEAVLEQVAREVLEKCVIHTEEDRLLIDCQLFTYKDLADQADRAVLTTAIRMSLERLGLGMRDVTADHIEAIVDLAADAPAASAVDLPAGGRAERQGKQLLLTVQSQ